LGKWYILGRWSYHDTYHDIANFHRTSVGGQGNKDGFVAIDTFITNKQAAVAYRLRLTLYRRQGSDATPTVSRYSAIASDLSNQKNTLPSPTTMGGVQKDLAVPRYSQELHRGEYPEFDNGGEAWCSPTSTAMVVDYWGAGPPASDYAYVSQRYPNVIDPVVARAMATGRTRRDFVREVRLYRLLLEAEAAALAAERASDRQRAELRVRAADLDGDDAVRAAQRLRRLVALASGNRPLAATIRALDQSIEPRLGAGEVQVCGRLAVAVADGDADAARDAARELNAATR